MQNKLYKGHLRLPWTLNTAPHCVIDILRGCNVQCKACYNSTLKIHLKSLEEIKKDFNLICEFRPVSAVGLIGGEPLLHPQLFDIIKFLKEQNVSIEIFSNGLLLTKELCKNLKKAGVDLIFLHIDLGQKRVDLHDNTSIQEVKKLREQKAQMICEAGMEAGMSITLQRSQLDSYSDTVREFHNSRFLTYFLTTLYRDTRKVGQIKGSLKTSIVGSFTDYSSPEELTMDEVYITLKKDSLKPYAAIMGSQDKNTPRWLTIMSAISYTSKKIQILNFSPSSFEEKFLSSYFKKHGFYPFYNKQNPIIARLQILFNGIYAKRLRENLPFLLKNMFHKIVIKRVLIQNPACIAQNGLLEHCECCPDMTVKDGQLVPVCMCDNLSIPDSIPEIPTK